VGTFITKVAAWLIDIPALRAGDFQFTCTLIAKLCSLSIIRLAFWALHLRYPPRESKSPHQGKSTHPNEGLILTLNSYALPQMRRLGIRKYRILHCDMT
jgi:hypothetical protein